MVLLALVSWLAFVVAKRWDVRPGTSGSSQRDRRQPGALAAPRTSELWLRVRRREAGARSNVNAGWDRDGVVELAPAGCWFLIVSRCLLHSPLRKHRGVEEAAAALVT